MTEIYIHIVARMADYRLAERHGSDIDDPCRGQPGDRAQQPRPQLHKLLEQRRCQNRPVGDSPAAVAIRVRVQLIGHL